MSSEAPGFDVVAARGAGGAGGFDFDAGGGVGGRGGALWRGGGGGTPLVRGGGGGAGGCETACAPISVRFCGSRAPGGRGGGGAGGRETWAFEMFAALAEAGSRSANASSPEPPFDASASMRRY